MALVDVTQLNMLVVEDNVHFRTLIRSILEALGISKVEEAHDGIEALEILGDSGENPFDLVILDWKMEGMDGVECVSQIRQLDCGNRAVPIIMVTGYTETSLQHEARDAGVNDFWVSPSRRSLCWGASSVSWKTPGRWLRGAAITAQTGACPNSPLRCRTGAKAKFK